MNNSKSVSSSQVSQIALLAHIPIDSAQKKNLAQAFSETLEVIDKLLELDTAQIEPTHQVTELENVWREDVVDQSRQLSQQAALANAKQVHKGYLVVPKILENRDA
jgi:aspartyl-tRNA(Asn)/glutamyl-tRNA(Gln) amidotransferase subunit C